MSDRLLVSHLEGELLLCRVGRDGALLAVALERAAMDGQRGDRFWGRVLSVERGLGAVFVELGLGRPGFLPLGGDRAPSPGDALLVEVVRGVTGAKGPKLRRLAEAPPADVGRGGPGLVKRGEDALLRLAADGEGLAAIVVAGAKGPALLRERLTGHPRLQSLVKLHAGPGPLLEDGVEETLESWMKPCLPLPGGGLLWIEPTQAFVAVDVDSARHHARGGPDQLAREVNREAALALGPALRRRDLSGRILVDFLEPVGPDHRAQLRAMLTQVLDQEAAPARLLTLGRSGLAEILRPRLRPPLHELFLRRSDWGGWLPDPAALAFRLLRRFREGAAALAPTLLVSPAVAAALSGPCRPALEQVAAERGRMPRVLTEPGRADEAAEIVLG